MTASRPPAAPAGPLVLVAAAYFCSLAQSQVSFVGMLAGVTPFMDPMTLVRETLALELADTLFLGLMLLVIPRPPRLTNPRSLAAWPVALALLPVVLAVNFGYSHVVQALLKSVIDLPDDVMSITLDYGVWAIILVCLQPAVVEELFFRHLLMGHLRPHLGTHGAVWASAVLFALAHVGRGPSWVILALVGAYLGYARIRSRMLILPMILHFLHNLGVLYWE